MLDYASPASPAADAAWRPALRRRLWILVMQAIQSLLIIATFVSVNPDTLPAARAACVTCAAVMGLQWLFLMPIVRPEYTTGRGKPWMMWVGAGTAGLMVGILATCALALGADFLVATNVITNYYAQPDPGFFLVPGLIAILAVWAVSTPLIVAFMQRGHRDQRLCQIAASIFLGTVVEALASISVMRLIARKQDCVCATFSFLAAFLSMAIGFILLGPAIFLVIFWRRSRLGHRTRCQACGYVLPPLAHRDRCPICGAGWKAV
jgi:hypothetical protein